MFSFFCYIVFYHIAASSRLCSAELRLKSNKIKIIHSFIQYINKISSNRCIKKFSTYFTLPYGFSHRIFSATNHDGNFVTFDIFNFHYFRSVWKKISQKKIVLHYFHVKFRICIINRCANGNGRDFFLPFWGGVDTVAKELGGITKPRLMSLSIRSTCFFVNWVFLELFRDKIDNPKEAKLELLLSLLSVRLNCFYKKCV